MSPSCRCCLIGHPSCLLERLSSSIQTIKFIRTNCTIFENILLDEYEHLERLLSNLNRYLSHSGNTSDLSQLTTRLNTRLNDLSNFLYEIECLNKSCSIWMKNSSAKALRSQLKNFGKQLHAFEHFVEQHSSTNDLPRKFWKDFALFRSNYHKHCSYLEKIEREHLNFFSESIRLFSSILPTKKHERSHSMINIDRNLEQWNVKNRFRITWLPEEHHHLKEGLEEDTLLKRCSSEVEIKTIDDCSSDQQVPYAYESNLSWSFTLPPKIEEDLPLPSLPHQPMEMPQPSINVPKSRSVNRVQLAIEAIERKTRQIPRERESHEPFYLVV